MAVFARLLPGPRSIDDSFITFRYAQNLLSGNGFVYNPGEQVLGTTTPLYTLLMAAIALPFGKAQANFPQIAMIFNALLDALSCVLIVFLGKKLPTRWAAWGAAVAWAIAPWSVSFAIGGMETSLLVFLLLSATTGYLYQLYWPSSLAAALAVLTRPDAIIFVAPMLFDRLLWDQMRRKQPVQWQEFVAFLLPISIWVGFSYSYFHRLLPQSIAAKSVVYTVTELSALIRFIQHYATPFMAHESFGSVAIYIGFILYPFLYFLGSRKLLNKAISLWFVVVYPIFYAIVFAIANPLIFRWYLTPPLVFYIILVLVGVEKFLNDLFKGFSPGMRNKLIAIFVMLVPSTLLLNAWTLHPDHGLQRPAPKMAWNQLELLYIDIGQSLRELQLQNPELVLAAGDIGALGYTSQAKILDTVGLISPEALAYYPNRETSSHFAYAIPTALILDQLPDVVVSLEIYGRGGLFEDPRFLSTYSLYQKIQTDIYDSQGMLIFIKAAQNE